MENKDGYIHIGTPQQEYHCGKEGIELGGYALMVLFRILGDWLSTGKKFRATMDYDPDNKKTYFHFGFIE